MGKVAVGINSGMAVHERRNRGRLTPDQRVIAWRLANGHCVSVNDLLHHLYGTREDGGARWDIQVLRTHMTSIRNFVGRQSGITIEAMYDVGYAVRGDLDFYRSLLADEIDQNVRFVGNRLRLSVRNREQQQVVA